MTSHEALASHLTKRPEMPRPYVPDSPAAKAHQEALQTWVNERERLEVALTPHVDCSERQQPRCTTASDYEWTDITKPRKRNRPPRPAWSGATPEYNAQKKRESREKQRERAFQAVRDVIKERDAA